MRKRSIALFTFLIVVCLACSKPNDMGDFDAEKWREDIKGCNGDRSESIDDLIKAKSKLLGLYQKTIINILGQPEDQELYKRSQTYYVYYIDPSPDCENSSEDPRVLEVRFTSLGIANEVNIR